jgi:hypothetical protein
MKEILIFIAIVLIAVIAFSAFQNSKIDGASLLSAFKFDLKPPSANASNKEQTAPNSTPQTSTSTTGPTAPPTPTPTPAPILTPAPSTSEQGVTSPREPEALSLLYQKITISGITKKTSTHPSVIRLRVSTKEKIDLTGFIVQTRQGEFKIPEGMEKYQAYGADKDITVESYMTLYLIGEKSPLSTDAFRVNECLGYLNQYEDFYPSIYNYCPKPELEDLYDLNPFCQDYILKLRRCQIPNYSTNLKISSNSYCTSYISENLNYSGCFKNYSNEDIFLKNYWYIYTKSDLVEPLHDIIYLYDQNGYLVDDYAY